MMATRAQQRPARAAPERTETGRSTETGREFEFTSADFARIRDLIHRAAGISLSDHKRDMAYSRLARRLRARGLDTFRQYLDMLEAENHPAEGEAVTNALPTKPPP